MIPAEHTRLTEENQQLRRQLLQLEDLQKTVAALHADNESLRQELHARRAQIHEMGAALERERNEKKRILKIVKESENRFRTIFEAAPIGIMIMNAQGYPFVYNQAVEKILGYNMAELKTLPPETYFHPDDLENARAHFRKMKRDGMPFRLIQRFFRKDGAEVWVKSTTAPIPNQENHTIFAITMLEDISAQKQREDELNRLASALKSIGESVIMTDLEGKIIFVNDTFEKTYGFQKQEVLGRDTGFLHASGTSQQCLREIREATWHAGWQGELLHRDRQGREFPVFLSTSTVKNEHGVPTAVISVLRNNTEIKQAEQQIQAAESKYRALFEEAPVMYVTTYNDHGTPVITACNHLFLRALGYTADEIVGRPLATLYSEESRKNLEEGGYERALAGRFDAEERQLLAKDGTVIHTLLRAVPECDADGAPIGTRAMFVDISDRKHAQEEVAHLKHFYSAILDHMPIQIAVFDLEGRYQYLNPAGMKDPELRQWIIGKTDLDYCERRGLPAAIARTRSDAMKKALESGRIIHLEEKLPSQGNGLRILEWVFTPIFDEEEKITHIIGYAKDITEQKQAEERLRKNKERYQFLYENNPTMFFTLDEKGIIVSVNEFGASQLGYRVEELVGQPVLSVFYEEDRPAVQEQFRRCLQQPASVAHWKFRKIKKDGTIIWVEEHARAVKLRNSSMNVLVVCEDVTGRRKLEMQMLHAQKLESIGILAGGIAHDFNNLLTGILGNANFALLQIAENSPIRPRLVNIEKAAQRAAGLCRQLLAYAGKGTVEVQPVHLNLMIEDMIHLLRLSISKNIQLHTCFEKNLPFIDADPTQIQQIFMNFITNASDAIGDKNGQISITTGVRHFSSTSLNDMYLSKHLTEGDYIFLSVTDDGSGIEPGAISRIFDPFYTTKRTGRGLGLAAVLGIIQAHGGGIHIDSDPGNGTTFTVIFPPSRNALLKKPVEKPVCDNWHGKGTVLIVDDEPQIRDVSRTSLENLGFRTILACDGREALRIFEEKFRDINLVLLDVLMPNLNGKETFLELRKIRHDVPILLISGYNEENAASLLTQRDYAAFLAKPFTPQDLVAKVREILRS